MENRILSKKYGIPWTTGKEREARITEFRIAKGILIRELAEKTGLRPTDITNLDSGIDSPLEARGARKGQVKLKVIELCKLLGQPPEEVFPRYICKIERYEPYPDNFILDMSTSIYCRNASKSPEELYEDYQYVETLKANKVLSNAQIGMLFSRSEGCTLEEIGEELCVTRECIRQMEHYTREVLERWFTKGKPPKHKRYTGEYNTELETKKVKRKDRLGFGERCPVILGPKRPVGRPKKNVSKEL